MYQEPFIILSYLEQKLSRAQRVERKNQFFLFKQETLKIKN